MRVGKQKSKIALNYLVLPPICYLSRKEDRQLTACTEYLLRKTDFSSEQLGKEIQIMLSLHGQFLYPKRGQKKIFFDPLPPHLVHVVIECHLAEKED